MIDRRRPEFKIKPSNGYYCDPNNASFGFLELGTRNWDYRYSCMRYSLFGNHDLCNEWSIHPLIRFRLRLGTGNLPE